MLPNPPWPRRSPTPHRKSNFTGENFDRYQRTTPIEAQQPNTNPDDAFGIWDAANTAGQWSRIDEAHNLTVVAENEKWTTGCRKWATGAGIEMWAYA
jgi:hypothetical protein